MNPSLTSTNSNGASAARPEREPPRFSVPGSRSPLKTSTARGLDFHQIVEEELKDRAQNVDPTQ
jgi:hypothetical protein